MHYTVTVSGIGFKDVADALGKFLAKNADDAGFTVTVTEYDHGIATQAYGVTAES